MMIESLLKPLLGYIMNFDSYFYKMTKLETLIELNNLEKQNRKNRLEDKLKQQENYGEIEELFDPLTKTLNTITETMQALQNKTMAVLDSNTNTLNSLGHHRGTHFSLVQDTAHPTFVLYRH